MSSFYSWSQTAATNASADSSVNWAEGQAPSSVNDSARAMMASTAKYRDDIAGAIATGGTSTAYTVSTFQVYDTLAHLSGQAVAFTPHTTCGATVTLNVDGLGAKALRTSPGVELQSGMLVQGTPYVALYSNSTSAFYLQSFYGNPFNIPIGGGMVYVGTSVPNSAFAFPNGQAISRTTYSTLFGLTSTIYGAGDGSTTFNLPDFTGRTLAMKESSATRLTSTYFGGNSTVMGATGGLESNTLATANLPPYTPAGSVASTVTNGASGGSTSHNTTSSGTQATVTDGTVIGITSTFTGTAQGGTTTPFKNVQPTIITNYILRII